MTGDAYQRWTVTLPNGDGLDVWIENLYEPEMKLRRLFELADCEAYATHTNEPPDHRPEEG